MINIIKRAVESQVSQRAHGTLSNGVACALYCLLQEDLRILENLNKEIFDLAKMAEIIGGNFIELSKDKDIMECTPLDFADMYCKKYKGNSIIFLKNYQDYIGPIE